MTPDQQRISEKNKISLAEVSKKNIKKSMETR